MSRKQAKRKHRARQAHQRQTRQLETFTRAAAIDRASVDAKARTAAVSFSSQSPVQDRFFGPPTVLLHERGAADLGPIRDMGAALLNHDPGTIIGRVDDVEIDESDRRGRAVIHFDDDDEGNRALAKVKSGSLRGVSVRFSVDRAQVLREKDEWQSPGGQKFTGGTTGLEVVTRWTPREISLTPIPADTSVGVGRKQERNPPMFSERTMERLRAHGLSVEAFASEDAAIAVLDKLDAQSEERGLRPRFEKLASRVGQPELVGRWLSRGVTEDEAYGETVAILESRNPRPVGPPLERGFDAAEKTRVAIEAGLSRRCGVEYEPPPEFKGHDLPSHISIPAAARMFCRAANVPNVDLMSTEQVIEAAFRLRRPDDHARAAMGGHTTGDFPAVLANVANKNVLMGAAEANTTYQLVSTPKELRNFQTHTFVQAGEIENLVETPDTFQFPAATMADKSGTMVLATFARKIGFGRQALINDDVNALTDLSRKLGNASARTRNKLFWDHVTQSSGVGPTMPEDSEALFSASHPSGSNYFVDAAANLQRSSLAKGRELLRKQKALTASKLANRVDPSTPGYLNVPAAFLIVPAALEDAADALVNAVYFPIQESTAQLSFIRNLTIVTEPQLDATSTKAWYLFARPTTIDTVAFATLAGQRGPMFRTWQVDDGLTMWFAVVDDIGVQALEHRGVFRSKGEA